MIEANIIRWSEINDRRKWSDDPLKFAHPPSFERVWVYYLHAIAIDLRWFQILNLDCHGFPHQCVQLVQLGLPDRVKWNCVLEDGLFLRFNDKNSFKTFAILTQFFSDWLWKVCDKGSGCFKQVCIIQILMMTSMAKHSNLDFKKTLQVWFKHFSQFGVKCIFRWANGFLHPMQTMCIEWRMCMNDAERMNGTEWIQSQKKSWDMRC